MNYEAFTKLQNDEFEFLDTIDIKPYLADFKDIYDVEDEIQKDYGKSYCEGFIFNCIGVNEFMDYLSRRYSGEVAFDEHITYTVRLLEED